MLLSESLPPQLKHFDPDCLGLIISTLSMVGRREICQTADRIWMLLSESLPPQLKHFDPDCL
ncbi:hypothetical protein BFJ67_g15874, partial [Fusarium oxysporum f. sp. cepae]